MLEDVPNYVKTTNSATRMWTDAVVGFTLETMA